MDPDTGEDGAASDEGVGGRGEEGKRWITQSVVSVGVSRNYQRTRHERSSGVRDGGSRDVVHYVF